jgi:exopolysaccharide production protein ExoQ
VHIGDWLIAPDQTPALLSQCGTHFASITRWYVRKSPGPSKARDHEVDVGLRKGNREQVLRHRDQAQAEWRQLHTPGRSPAPDFNPWLLAVDGLIILFLIIHMQALISLPLKLNGGTPVPGSGLVWLAGALIGIGLATLRLPQTARYAPALLPFIALCAWAFLSFGWSSNSFDTIKSACYMLASLAGACALAARLSWEGILLRLTIAIGLLIVLSVALALALPSIGRMQEIHVGAWSGVWMEKQAMGMYASLLILAALCLFLANPRYKAALLLVPLSYIAILGTTGKTALLMSLLGVCVLVIGWLVQRSARLALLTVWGSIAIGVPLAFFIVTAPDLVFRLLGRSSDFTGRTEIWREVGFLIERQPMTGYGFGGIWTEQQSLIAPYQWIAEGTGFLPQNAHSSWLDAQLQLGLPGFALVICCLVTAWLATAVRLRGGGPGALFAFSALSTITLISFTETILMTSMDLPWFLVALITAKLLSEPNSAGEVPVAPDIAMFAPRPPGTTRDWDSAPTLEFSDQPFDTPSTHTGPDEPVRPGVASGLPPFPAGH